MALWVEHLKTHHSLNRYNTNWFSVFSRSSAAIMYSKKFFLCYGAYIVTLESPRSKDINTCMINKLISLMGCHADIGRSAVGINFNLLET